MEHKTLHIAPIGVLRKDEKGVRVELERAYAPGLLGLELYSHVHILWWFDRRDNPEDRSRLQVRPPHRGTPGPMGVFASRSPSRPNPIALSTGRIVDRERGCSPWTGATRRTAPRCWTSNPTPPAWTG